MKIYLKKVWTILMNIEQNPIKKTNTTRPVTKKIKKNKKELNMENQEMHQKSYISIQTQKLTYQMIVKPIIIPRIRL